MRSHAEKSQAPREGETHARGKASFTYETAVEVTVFILLIEFLFVQLGIGFSLFLNLGEYRLGIKNLSLFLSLFLSQSAYI